MIMSDNTMKNTMFRICCYTRVFKTTKSIL
jgi:hypothetical protein